MAKAAYVAAANALCRTMNARSDALGDPGNDPSRVAEVARATAAIISETLQKLRALPAPAGDAAVVNAIYAKAEVLTGDYRQLATAIRSRDRAQVNRLVDKANSDMAVANAAANAYGLTVCGS